MARKSAFKFVAISLRHPPKAVGISTRAGSTTLLLCACVHWCRKHAGATPRCTLHRSAIRNHRRARSCNSPSPPLPRYRGYFPAREFNRGADSGEAVEVSTGTLSLSTSQAKSGNTHWQLSSSVCATGTISTLTGHSSTLPATCQCAIGTVLAAVMLYSLLMNVHDLPLLLLVIGLFRCSPD